MGKFLDFFRRILQPLRSPVFLTVLVISFFLWYGIKLSHIYTAEVPVKVTIEGERYKVQCLVEARGTELWAQRLSLGSKVNIPLDEIINRKDTTINAVKLGDAIMQRTSTLKILKVIEVPSVELASE